MGDTINIGGLCAAPGQRVHGFISIGDGEFSLPATIVLYDLLQRLNRQKDNYGRTIKAYDYRYSVNSY